MESEMCRLELRDIESDELSWSSMKWSSLNAMSRRRDSLRYSWSWPDLAMPSTLSSVSVSSWTMAVLSELDERVATMLERDRRFSSTEERMSSLLIV